MDARASCRAGPGHCPCKRSHAASLSSSVLRYLRALLILGRVSNLPTVWSNILAGWWLGGADSSGKLPWLFAGATFLYLGGMFLNDAFDAVFDRQYRPERPIPSGHIGRRAVWKFGFVFIAVGAGCLWFLSDLTGALGLALALCILLYDATHKHVSFAPVIMGACRLLLYLTAAASAP